MSTIDFYFQPLGSSLLEGPEYASQHCIAQAIERYETHFPEAEKAEIAIFGVCDGRHSFGNEETALAPDAIRKQFYKLSALPGMKKVVDLGNITAGETEQDTLFAVRQVIERLLRINVLPIILGGANHLAYAQFVAYEFSRKMVDFVQIDSRFDMDEPDPEDTIITDRNYLYRIIMHQPCYLFNCVNLGYQTHLNPFVYTEMFERLFFDAIRLGKLREDITLAEPALRGADALSFDVSSIRRSEFPANAHATPNGFYNDEACQMARYAGMSDKLTSIGFYNYNPLLDKDQSSAFAVGEMMWYFIEGFCNRVNDFPLKSSAQFAKYHVEIDREGHHALIFHKSKRTGRWWIEVPAGRGNETFENIRLVPCTYDDYKLASEQGELPDIWWRFHQKYFV